MNALLEVEHLRISLPTARGPADALRGVSFAIGRARPSDWWANRAAASR